MIQQISNTQNYEVIKSKTSIGKAFFIYFFAAVLPQVAMISNKGSIFDTLWKALAICSFSIYMLIYVLRKELKLKIMYLICGTIYCASNLLGLMLSLESQSSISDSIISIFTILDMIFICCLFANSIIPSKKDIDWFLNAYIIFVLYSCIFNIIDNFSLIKNLFSIRQTYQYSLSSFFANRNNYAKYLYLGVIACVMQYANTRKKRFVFAGLLVFGSLLITFSRTGLYSTLIFLIFFIILQYKRNMDLCTGVLLILLVSVLLLFSIDVTRNFIQNIVMRPEAGITGRDIIWKYTFSLIKGLKVIFGYGENVVENMIYELMKTRTIHNGLLCVIGSGGLIKLSLYIMLICNLLFKVRYIRKNNFVLGNVLLAALASFFAYSMFEDIVLLHSSDANLIMTLFNVVIPTLLFNYYKNKRAFEEQK